MKINYISSESLNHISGGWSGLNAKIVEGLSSIFDTKYIFIENPKIQTSKWILSKFLRILGLPGNYFFYSDNRLLKYARKIISVIKDETVCVFMGSTPWIKYKPISDYYIITDISFLGYYTYYNKHDFRSKDINRIINLEIEFMRNASAVFFTSRWALEETVKFYNMTGNNFVNIGIAGNIEGKWTPVSDSFTSFLYISQNFEKKGGNELFSAFKQLYNRDTSIELRIIGGKPPKNVQKHPGVRYFGFLNKTLPGEKDKYVKLVSSSSFLVLPTKSDAAPLTIIECGYFGTPTIAPAKFAIPEMVIPDKTGILLQTDFDVTDILKALTTTLEMKLEKRNQLRRTTYDHYQENNTWSKICIKIENRLTKIECTTI